MQNQPKLLLDSGISSALNVMIILQFNSRLEFPPLSAPERTMSVTPDRQVHWTSTPFV
jgi:hypothetical protein